MVRLHYMDMQFYLEDLLAVPVDLVLADCVKPRLQPIIAQLAGRDQGRDTTDRLAKDRGSSESAPARIFRCQHPGGLGHLTSWPPSGSGAAFAAEAWDWNFETDATAGKLEGLAAQALRDHAAGRSTPL